MRVWFLRIRSGRGFYSCLESRKWYLPGLPSLSRIRPMSTVELLGRIVVDPLSGSASRRSAATESGFRSFSATSPKVGPCKRSCKSFRGLKSTMCGRVSHTARILPTFVSLISTTWREFQARRRASSTTFHRYAGNGVHVTANSRATTRYLSGRARRQDRGSADLHRCPSARSW